MGLVVESRPSELPYIERVWRSRSEDVGQMMSVATSHWELVFWEHQGQVEAAVLGPEAKASRAPGTLSSSGSVSRWGRRCRISRSAGWWAATRRSRT